MSITNGEDLQKISDTHDKLVSRAHRLTYFIGAATPLVADAIQGGKAEQKIKNAMLRNLYDMETCVQKMIKRVLKEV